MVTEKLRKRLTVDQVSEFALHSALQRETGMKVYFFSTHNPWQKETVENVRERLRRWLPREPVIKPIPQTFLDRLSALFNNRPRKCLEYLTPNGLIKNNILRLCRASV